MTRTAPPAGDVPASVKIATASCALRRCVTRSMNTGCVTRRRKPTQSFRRRTPQHRGSSFSMITKWLTTGMPRTRRSFRSTARRQVSRCGTRTCRCVGAEAQRVGDPALPLDTRQFRDKQAEAQSCPVIDDPAAPSPAPLKKMDSRRVRRKERPVGNLRPAGLLRAEAEFDESLRREHRRLGRLPTGARSDREGLGRPRRTQPRRAHRRCPPALRGERVEEQRRRRSHRHRADRDLDHQHRAADDGSGHPGNRAEGQVRRELAGLHPRNRHPRPG